jgi:hypothetical protein
MMNVTARVLLLNIQKYKKFKYSTFFGDFKRF